ncbi:hypothetical protein SteCoe_19668 [Stentor coeruleus]|uniref:Uncharacterized protein n=1 Tax=Stentor coeruleus TaxID=5963 RepID=A0A1R2BTY2_9CILI|nr:hypothetical protein SteCoe_19668 [Stentor coeruleus]
MLEEDNTKSEALIRANLDIECLKDNLLTAKNNIIDQAGLLKVLELKNDQIKSLELENSKLTQEFIKLKEEQLNFPFKIEELQEEKQALLFTLQSKELIKEQLEYQSDINLERIQWKLEKKNHSIMLNKKEKQIQTLKDLYEKLTRDHSMQKHYHTEDLNQKDSEIIKLHKSFKKKLKKKKLKLRKLEKLLLKKYLEYSKHRTQYKVLKKTFEKKKYS